MQNTVVIDASYRLHIELMRPAYRRLHFPSVAQCKFAVYTVYTVTYISKIEIRMQRYSSDVTYLSLFLRVVDQLCAGQRN